MRQLLLFVAVLCVIFCFALGAIRAQHYDDSDLRAFLYGGCAQSAAARVPCWQGILPGVTTFGEALALLQSHPWIADLTIEESFSASFVSWRWSGLQPFFLTDVIDRGPPSLWATNDHVSFITLPTTLTYGEVERLVGAPDDGVFQVFRPQERPRAAQGISIHLNTHHFAAYDDAQMVVETRLTCPAPALMFWNAPVTFTIFSSGLMRDVPFGVYNLTAWLYDAPCPSSR